MRIIPEIAITLDEIKLATKAVAHYKANQTIGAIVTHSKEALPGDLFVALPSDKTSGEDYIDEATARGAYVLSARSVVSDLLVNDTYLALLDIASFYKTKLTALRTTVAITGSVGKTTTKNILSKMLSPYFKVHSTKGNYNNFLGAFHTVMTTPKNTEILITELGMNHLGEIGTLSRAIRPDISIITNIGTSHIGNLGSRKLIATSKLEILDGMQSPRLIVPYGEPLLSDIQSKRTVSLKEMNADCCVIEKEIEYTHSLVDIYTKLGKISMQKISLSGRHVLHAIAFSVEVMTELGLNIEKIKSALSSLDDSLIRAKAIDIGEITVYDDTYSSSPEAVIADLDFLLLKDNRRRSCMLGDMLELGVYTESMHKKIGYEAARRGFGKIFAFGVYSPFIKAGAISGGLTEDKIFINTDLTAPEYTAKQIFDNYTEGELILFKASHATHAEKIIEILIQLIENKKQKRKGNG